MNKIVRSRDVVFFEDQTIADIHKGEKSESLNEYPVNLDPLPLPMVHDNGRDTAENPDDIANEDPEV